MANLSEVEEALKREKQAKRNLSRRKCYLKKKGKLDVQPIRQLDCDLLISKAKQECEELLTEGQRKYAAMLNLANEEANQITSEARDGGKRIGEAAREEADGLLQKAMAEVETMKQQRDTLAQKLKALRKRINAAKRKASYWSRADSSSGRGSSGSGASVASTLGKRARRASDAASEEGLHRAPDSPTPNRKRRCINNVATDVVRFLQQKVATFNHGSKKAVLAKMWTHSALKPYQPSLLGCPKADMSLSAALAEMRKTLSIVKTARRKDYLAAKYQILSGFAGVSTKDQRLQTALASILEVRRQNVYKATKIRAQLDFDSSKRFPMGERKVRCDKISDAVRAIVEQYWESHTRISPCKNNIARKRVGRKEYEKHQVHWLEETQVAFYLEFAEWCRKEQNGVSIQMRSFLYMKPYYVRKMKDRNVCCCKHHVEVDLLKEAMNKFRQHQHNSNDCICDCSTCKPSEMDPVQSRCVATRKQITSVRSWIEEALCPRKEGQEWHNKSCIMGECKDCGVKNVQWCKAEIDPLQIQWIDWQAFEYVELDETTQQKREKKKGNAESSLTRAKRLRLVYRRTSMLDFQKQVLNVMPGFIVHNFRSRWQSEQFRECLKTFPRGTVVSSIDFSENYTFLPQNEIQSQHWDNKQVTLLIHVTYRHREDSDSVEAAVGLPVKLAQRSKTDTRRDIIADYHFYVSDDNKHDTLFVQHCMDLHWGWMAKLGIRVDQHWVWSDGAASQFKACRPFYYVSRYYSRHGARMKWFFHASGHGKGVADALGGHIKTGLAAEQLRGLQGHRLESAHDVVSFCKDKFALGAVKEYGDVQMVRRVFWEIPVGEVNRQKRWDCDPIKNCRNLHSFDGFSSTLSTLLQVRELSCFCPACVDDDSVNCENEEWVGKYRLEMVKGVKPADVKPQVELIGPGEGEVEDGLLAECVQLGEWYACVAHPESVDQVDFYIYQCVQVLHTVKEDFEDGYKVSFKKGERVLKGQWFQASSGSELKYVLNDKAAFSYQRPEEVIHIRFALTPVEVHKGSKGQGARTYRLDHETLEAILQSLGS